MTTKEKTTADLFPCARALNEKGRRLLFSHRDTLSPACAKLWNEIVALYPRPVMPVPGIPSDDDVAWRLITSEYQSHRRVGFLLEGDGEKVARILTYRMTFGALLVIIPPRLLDSWAHTAAALLLREKGLCSFYRGAPETLFMPLSSGAAEVAKAKFLSLPANEIAGAFARWVRAEIN